MNDVSTRVCYDSSGILHMHGGTAGQRELVYRQRFFNLSILALKARQLAVSPVFFYCVFTVFTVFGVSSFHFKFARPPNS